MQKWDEDTKEKQKVVIRGKDTNWDRTWRRSKTGSILDEGNPVEKAKPDRAEKLAT